MYIRSYHSQELGDIPIVFTKGKLYIPSQSLAFMLNTKYGIGKDKIKAKLEGCDNKASLSGIELLELERAAKACVSLGVRCIPLQLWFDAGLFAAEEISEEYRDEYYSAFVSAILRTKVDEPSTEVIGRDIARLEDDYLERRCDNVYD